MGRGSTGAVPGDGASWKDAMAVSCGNPCRKGGVAVPKREGGGRCNGEGI